MPISISGDGPITGITSLNTTVDSTELGYLNGTTSAIQTQINTKASSASPTFTGTVTGADLPFGTRVRTYFGRTTFTGNGTASNFASFSLPVLSSSSYYAECRLMPNFGSYAQNSELWVGSIRVHDEGGSTWDAVSFTASARNDNGSKQGSYLDIPVGTLTGSISARSANSHPATLNLFYNATVTGAGVVQPMTVNITYHLTLFAVSDF